MFLAFEKPAQIGDVKLRLIWTIAKP